MAVIYGVLRAKLDRWKREDPPASSKKSPHLQIRVTTANGTAWRIPVNVRSEDKAKSLVILHRVEPLLSHPILANLKDLPSGLTDLNDQSRSSSNALDYLRAPIFDWAEGVVLPPTGDGDNDDLQDVLASQLTKLKAVGGEIIAFGSHWKDPAPKPGIDTEFGTQLGMHDIHMNQGNAKGEHDEDNGVFNDGGLILKFPDRYVGFFFRFKTQWLPTDNHGNRTPASHEVPPGIAPGTTPSAPIDQAPTETTFPAVYIERALVNPVGEDSGNEVVVLGNTTGTMVNLKGWKIVDTANRAETIGAVSVSPGASIAITLSGSKAQLSNKGGTIRLLTASGDQAHAVSYSQADAVEGRYVRFNN